MFAAADDILAGSELDEQHSDINTDQSREDDCKRAALSIINPPEYCKVVKNICQGTVNVKCEDDLIRQCVCPKPASTCNRNRLKGTHKPGWYKKVIPGLTSTQRQPIGHSETYVSFAQMKRVESLERKSASRTAYVTQQDEDGRSAASDYSLSSASAGWKFSITPPVSNDKAVRVLAPPKKLDLPAQTEEPRLGAQVPN
eukprot:CAMPEP_0168251924 /NCGR_PEP_ID=MMETSP0141_2-20121125/3343_1 /TAXON_ID=44445 /ORGANISM="Pseudo-nitzschia australis, Strain 10249 10 AB" /LENGTH=198 /DNA_ID=CAMNT_0008188115 /DNA_START=1261 /DNA_END=1858 /DNA_ORIENTATION=-